MRSRTRVFLFVLLLVGAIGLGWWLTTVTSPVQQSVDADGNPVSVPAALDPLQRELAGLRAGYQRDFETWRASGAAAPALELAGWVPDWASPAGLQTLRSNSGRFAEVSPVWYEVLPDGNLRDKRPSNWQAIQHEVRQQGGKLVPTIATFDHELLAKVLRDPANLDRHANVILEQVATHKFDGIDLDYESMYEEDADNLFLLLKKLRDGLHPAQRELVFTVLAKWGDTVNYSSSPQTRRAQNWTRLGQYVDKVRIMAYDYAYSSSPPGYIAPLEWQRRILEYAVTQLPREKIVLGVHLYSYEWWMPASEHAAVQKQTGQDPLHLYSPESDPAHYGQLSTEALGYKFNNGGAARSYTYSTIANLLPEVSQKPQSSEGEAVLRYRRRNNQTGVDEERLLVYMSAEGLQQRVALANEYGISGLAFWRLGGEGQLLASLQK